jgi:hypothetical protein
LPPSLLQRCSQKKKGVRFGVGSRHVNIGAHSLERNQTSQGAISTISRRSFSSSHFLTIEARDARCMFNNRAAVCVEPSPGTGFPIVFLTSQDASTTEVMSFIRAFLYASSPLRNRSQHFLNALSCAWHFRQRTEADSLLRVTLCVWPWPCSSSLRDFPLYFRRAEQYRMKRQQWHGQQ